MKLFFVLFTIIVFAVLWANVCKIIMDNKGYDETEQNKYAIMGFFLGVIGVIIAASSPAISKTTDAPDVLLKYKALLDAGVITEQEFEKKKRELIE